MNPPAFEETTQDDVHILHLHEVTPENLVVVQKTETTVKTADSTAINEPLSMT
jgi:hypothetical protein